MQKFQDAIRQTTEETSLSSASFPPRISKRRATEILKEAGAMTASVQGEFAWEKYGGLRRCSVFLREQGLINNAAAEYFVSLQRKIRPDDHANVSFVTELVPSETAKLLESKQYGALGLIRRGNILVREDSVTTHHAAWSRDEPAYDSTKYSIVVAVIER